MGSSQTKEVGTEIVEQQQETNGGFHVLEVMQGDNYLWGLKIISFIIVLIIVSIQIHGATATHPLGVGKCQTEKHSRKTLIPVHGTPISLYKDPTWII